MIKDESIVKNLIFSIRLRDKLSNHIAPKFLWLYSTQVNSQGKFFNFKIHINVGLFNESFAGSGPVNPSIFMLARANIK